MKINVKQTLKTLDGKPLKAEGGQDFVLKDAIVNALLGPGEAKVDGTEKAARYSLAMSIYGAKGEIDFTAEEASKIKKLVGESYAPIIVGQVFRILDGK